MAGSDTGLARVNPGGFGAESSQPQLTPPSNTALFESRLVTPQSRTDPTDPTDPTDSTIPVDALGVEVRVVEEEEDEILEVRVGSDVFASADPELYQDVINIVRNAGSLRRERRYYPVQQVMRKWLEHRGDVEGKIYEAVRRWGTSFKPGYYTERVLDSEFYDADRTENSALRAARKTSAAVRSITLLALGEARRLRRGHEELMEVRTTQWLQRLMELDPYVGLATSYWEGTWMSVTYGFEEAYSGRFGKDTFEWLNKKALERHQNGDTPWWYRPDGKYSWADLLNSTVEDEYMIDRHVGWRIDNIKAFALRASKSDKPLSRPRAFMRIAKDSFNDENPNGEAIFSETPHPITDLPMIYAHALAFLYTNGDAFVPRMDSLANLRPLEGSALWERRREEMFYDLKAAITENYFLTTPQAREINTMRGQALTRTLDRLQASLAPKVEEVMAAFNQFSPGDHPLNPKNMIVGPKDFIVEGEALDLLQENPNIPSWLRRANMTLGEALVHMRDDMVARLNELATQVQNRQSHDIRENGFNWTMYEYYRQRNLVDAVGALIEATTAAEKLFKQDLTLQTIQEAAPLMSTGEQQDTVVQDQRALIWDNQIGLPGRISDNLQVMIEEGLVLALPASLDNTNDPESSAIVETLRALNIQFKVDGEALSVAIKPDEFGTYLSTNVVTLEDGQVMANNRRFKDLLVSKALIFYAFFPPPVGMAYEYWGLDSTKMSDEDQVLLEKTIALRESYEGHLDDKDYVLVNDPNFDLNIAIKALRKRAKSVHSDLGTTSEQKEVMSRIVTSTLQYLGRRKNEKTQGSGTKMKSW